MSSLNKYNSVADFLNNWLKILTIISAGVFGLLEYIEHKEDVRVERSLKYVERYNSSSFIELRNRLSDTVDKESDAIIITLSDSSLSAEEVQAKYNSLIIELISKNKLESQLRQLFDFHEEVVLCATAELCDEFVIKSFFTINAQQLFKAFYPYVCDQRKKWNDDSISRNIELYYINANANTCK